jgi:hypothetical protein
MDDGPERLRHVVVQLPAELAEGVGDGVPLA